MSNEYKHNNETACCPNCFLEGDERMFIDRTWPQRSREYIYKYPELGVRETDLINLHPADQFGVFKYLENHNKRILESANDK